MKIILREVLLSLAEFFTTIAEHLADLAEKVSA